MNWIGRFRSQKYNIPIKFCQLYLHIYMLFWEIIVCVVCWLEFMSYLDYFTHMVLHFTVDKLFFFSICPCKACRRWWQCCWCWWWGGCRCTPPGTAPPRTGRAPPPPPASWVTEHSILWMADYFGHWANYNSVSHA